MNPALAAEIEAAITGIVTRLYPGAKGRTMYGGTMFEKEPGNYKTAFCGVFCYENHVSLEFGRGSEMLDPAGVLEGKGKVRRHLKFREMADLAAKDVEGFIGQAISL
ncbi:MAG: DUF1801 domain-containing protein [Paracoccaceae bacterium]